MIGNRWPLERFEKLRTSVSRAASGGLTSLAELTERQGQIIGLRRADVVLQRSKELGRIPIQGHVPAATPDGEAFYKMEKVGADLLTATEVTALDGLKRPSSGRPIGLYLDQADPRVAAEAALAAGATHLSIPSRLLAKDISGAADQIAYVDRLIGFLEDNNRRIVREVAPAEPGQSVAATIAIALCETQWAIEQGVRRVVATIGFRGSLIEDVAALNVLRAFAKSWLSPGPGVEFYAGAAGWTGPAPAEIDRGFALALNTSFSAALARADLFTARPTHRPPDRDLKPILDGVQSARQMLDLSAGQWLEASHELARAEDTLKTAVLAILGDRSSQTLRPEDLARADVIIAAHDRTVDADSLFVPLPRETAQGLLTATMKPWSSDPLSETAT